MKKYKHRCIFDVVQCYGYYTIALNFGTGKKLKMRHWLLTKTSILFSAKKRKIKSSLWLHQPKKTPKLSTVKESEVVATPVQTKNVLIKPNSTVWSAIETIHNKRSNEVKNSALYNAEGQILLFSSDMERDISNRCFCPIVTVT